MPRLREDFLNSPVSLSNSSISSSRKSSASPPPQPQTQVQPQPQSPSQQDISLPSLPGGSFSEDDMQEQTPRRARASRPIPSANFLGNSVTYGGQSLASIREESRSREESSSFSQETQTPMPTRFGRRSPRPASPKSASEQSFEEVEVSPSARRNRSNPPSEHPESPGGTPDESPPASEPCQPLFLRV